MREEKVVMYESPEAASTQTVTGWVDAAGRFRGEAVELPQAFINMVASERRVVTP